MRPLFLLFMKAVYHTKMVGPINRKSEFAAKGISETGLLSDCRKLWNTVGIPNGQAARQHIRWIPLRDGQVEGTGIIKSPL